jgi:hypothetical protein
MVPAVSTEMGRVMGAGKEGAAIIEASARQI